MALSYEESAALMIDMDFRGRIKVACLKYADFIMNEASTVTAHNTRLKWAQAATTQPDLTASQVQPPVVMDSAVQSDGATIDDPTLQTSVETVVNKLM
jgi:hypothetical protein